MNPLSGQIPRRAEAFAKLVRTFQRSVYDAGGRPDWDFWKDKTLEEVFEVLCTNDIVIRYSGPVRRNVPLSADQEFPNA